MFASSGNFPGLGRGVCPVRVPESAACQAGQSSQNFARPENFAETKFLVNPNPFSAASSFSSSVVWTRLPFVTGMSADFERNGTLFPIPTLLLENCALMGSAVEAQESSVETTSDNLVDGETQPETGKTQFHLVLLTNRSEQIYELTIVLPPGQTPRTIKIIVPVHQGHSNHRHPHKSRQQIFDNILYPIPPLTT